MSSNKYQSPPQNNCIYTEITLLTGVSLLGEIIILQNWTLFMGIRVKGVMYKHMFMQFDFHFIAMHDLI